MTSETIIWLSENRFRQIPLSFTGKCSNIKSFYKRLGRPIQAYIGFIGNWGNIKTFYKSLSKPII